MAFFKKLASINFSDGFHLDEKLWANESTFHYPENSFFKNWGLPNFINSFH